MKTILIAYTLKNSSVAEFFTAMANDLAKKNKVVIVSYQTEVHDFFLSKEVEVLEWPSERPTGIRDFMFLFNLVRKYKPSIMISNFAAVNLFLVVGFLTGVKHRICWYHTHSSAHLKENILHRERKKYIYKLATLIITISNSAKSDLIEHYKVEKDKIKIIPNAVKKPDINDDKEIKRKLIYVGRLHPSKGFEVFLRALPGVLGKYDEFRVIVYGGHKGGSEMKKYEDLALDLGIYNSIEFRGFTSRKTIMKELASSYLCVVPSYFEAFCYVVIESFSVGTPVVGSNTTGIAEIIRDGVDGFLFEPGNTKELTQKIIDLIDNKTLRKSMSVNCQQRFLEKYELGKVVEGNLGLLIKKEWE